MADDQFGHQESQRVVTSRSSQNLRRSFQSRLPAPVNRSLRRSISIPSPTITPSSPVSPPSNPLAPLRTPGSSGRNSAMDKDSSPARKPKSFTYGSSRGRAQSRLTSRLSGRARPSQGSSESLEENENLTQKETVPRKPKPVTSAYRNVRSRIRVRRGRPMVSGFANVGAVFDDAKDEELHPQIIRMARKSGQLNLTNKGLLQVPRKVYFIHEIEEEEAKKLTMGMSMDGSDEDRWWEQADLTRLYLASNRISSIDDEISNLAALQILDLSDNCLTCLPSTIGQLTCLTRLNLSHNKLEELPTGLFLLNDLRSLQLNHNKLKELSEDIGNLNILEYLDISHNELEALPPSLGYLQRLSKINASYNKIKDVPDEIGDMFGLSQLDLTENNIETLPKAIGNLSKLEQLYLRHNALQFLPNLQNCINLKELHVGNNFISELEQEQLANLVGLRVLDLRDNKLDNLPDEITLLQVLERLDLTNNNLSTLPYHIGLLPNLKSMPLEGNSLRLIRRDIVMRGTTALLQYLRSRISAPINTFPGFENTPADTNRILDKTPIPDKYQMRTSQTMAYNEKASSIPDQLFENAKEASVRTVDISKNLLTQVPTSLEMLSSGHVSEIMMGMNKLTSIPKFIASFNHLLYLDLQNNQLTDLPIDLAELLHMREINLSSNRFTQLPACLYEMTTLEILFVGDNKLAEIYIDGLSKLERLATLDLHNNNIGYVPPTLGNMTQLRSLQLEGNPFRVPRPSILSKGTREILDFLRSRIVPE